MKNQKKSKAFSLIEIIVSLIVIGIVASTFPIMLQTSVNTSKTSAKEEVFYQEFSLLQLINSMYFDENSTKDDNYYKDLNATQGDSELFVQTFNNELNRLGKHQMNNNDLRSGSSDTLSHIGVDSGEIEGNDSTYDDIDDFNNFTEDVLSYGNIKLHVKVAYINDETNYSADNINFKFNYSNVNHSSNIKLITIYTTLDEQNITVSYPTMNIGESKYLSLEEISR